jgi:DNA invertase Pin-like site-specific DNA recombinase
LHYTFKNVFVKINTRKNIPSGGFNKMGKVLGYVRVSTKEQEIDRQLVKMIELGVPRDMIFIEKASGKDFNRPEYQLIRKVIGEGDVLYIDALDRLGRNYDQVISEWKYITREAGADIVILENMELFDSRKFKNMGEFGKVLEDQFLSLFSYVAAQERTRSKKRQAEGIAEAKKKGTKFGRNKVEVDRNEFKKVYDAWKDPNTKIKAVQAMKQLGLTKPTFYKRVKEYEIETGIR